MICRVSAALFILLVFCCGASAQTCSIPNTLTNGTNADANAVMANFNALAACINSGANAVPRSYLSGLTLSTPGSSSSFGIAQGLATSSDATTSMNFASAYSKTTAAWAVGTGAGSLDTGSIANNTWYHVFLIERTDTGVVDILVSLSPTAPALPASYTKQRRIGSMRTDGSAHWVLFHQLGDEFLWDLMVNDANAANPGTSGTLYQLTVPTGIIIDANLALLWFNVSSSTYVAISDPDFTAPTSVTATNSAWAFSGSSTIAGSTIGQVRVNTSGQVRATSSGSSGSMYLNTIGWTDHRGRDN